MRGRTLNDAFIILDEAQNTTTEQMKMFLTRLGFNSKMVITGDITQVDLPASPPLGADRDPVACSRASHGIRSSTSTSRTSSGTTWSRRSSAPTTRTSPRGRRARSAAERPARHEATAGALLMPAAVDNRQRLVPIATAHV